MGNKLWIAALALAIAPAAAQTPLERGKYLVEGILTCGNCHTPLPFPCFTFRDIIENDE